MRSEPQKLLTRSLELVTQQIAQIVLGKEHQIRLALSCLLARGHLLIEDLPGVGKTTLAHALAKTLGLEFQRIQFTSDLLPADITGVSIFDRDSAKFRFLAGPIFSQVILADEINRATPKAQSALLEAMEEHQVTADGETRALPEPFFVIATQNPAHQIGIFPLPESQLDRFLMRIELGYPAPEAERALLKGTARRDLIAGAKASIARDELAGLQAHVHSIHTSEALLDYLQAIIHYTRHAREFAVGLSPRAGLGLLKASQAWALISGRGHVLPEDVQVVLAAVVGHRLQGISERRSSEDISKQILNSVPIP